MANIYTGSNRGKQIPVKTGRFEESVAAGAPLSSIIVVDDAVLANNTIVFSLEASSTDFIINQAPYISSRTIGVDFTVSLDALNGGGSPITVFVDYAIF